MTPLAGARRGLLSSQRTGLLSSLSPRAYWSILDQGISSASSFVLVVAVARASDVTTVGQFLLAYLLYGFVLGVGRAIGGDVLLLRAAERPEEVTSDCRRLLGLAVALGALGAAGFGAGALAAGGGVLSMSLLVLGIALVPVVVQDALRYCLFAQGRPSLAAANDTIWLAIQVTLTVALVVVWDASTPAPYVLAWAAGALIAGAVGIWQTGLLPTSRDLRRWFTEDKGRVGSFFTDFSLMIAATHLTVYLIAVIATVDDVAAFRGMMLLFAPLDALFAGIRIMTLPALARAIGPGGAEVRKLAYFVALGSTMVTAVWALVIITLPDSVGHAVLGATWDVAEPLKLAIAVASAALYAALPLQAGLRALRSERRLVVLRVIQTVLLFAGIVAGASLDAAQGAAEGLAIASAAGALLWWQGFSRSSRTAAALVRPPAAHPASDLWPDEPPSPLADDEAAWAPPPPRPRPAARGRRAKPWARLSDPEPWPMTPSRGPLVEGTLGMALDSAPDQQQDLREALRVLRRRKWLLALLIIGLPAAAYLLSASAREVYTATAIVQVQGTAIDTSLFVPGNETVQAGVIAAAGRLVTTREVAAAAAERLEPRPLRGLEELMDAVSASSESETGFVTITADSHNAARSAEIANAFAAALVDVRSRQARAQVTATIIGIARQRARLSESDRAGRRALSGELQRLRALRAAQNSNAAIVEPAVVPESPASPKPLRNAAMAFILAVLMGGTLVFLIERLDPRIRMPEQLRRMAGLPVLGLLPRVFGSKRVAALHESEAIQSLRASLSYFDADDGLRSVVVASPGTGEGKTTVAISLAISLAHSGRDVILIDADLRRSTVAARMGLGRDGPTLSGVRTPGWLLTPALTEVPITGGRLRVLPAKPSESNPVEMIDPEQMRALVQTAEAICDIVVIDSTALLPVSDIVSILREVSGVILLARMNRTSREAVARSLEIVALAGGTVLGFVATYVPRHATDTGRRPRRPLIPEHTRQPSTSGGRVKVAPPRSVSEARLLP